MSALDRGVVPWRKPWSADVLPPINGVTNRLYRGVNVLLLSLTSYQDHRWLTGRQITAQGGYPRRGERGTLVVFWKRFEPPEEEASQARPPVLRYYRVFNAEQCDGLRLPAMERSPEQQHERIERAEHLVAEMPRPPLIRTGRSAWYRPSDDLVQMPPLGNFQSTESYYATLFHELAHATGHPTRLDRAGVNGQELLSKGSYGREELVAELASAFCCACLGLDNSTIEDAASYIGGWLTLLKSDHKAVVIAAAQAQRAADYIRAVQHDA